MHCWHQKVTVTKAGPDDRYGDMPVDFWDTGARLRALDDFERGGAEDFYAVVTIAGDESDNEDTAEQQAFEDMEDISPGYKFPARVDSGLGTIPITIEIRDEDGFLRWDDDHADVTPTRTATATRTSPTSAGADRLRC